MASNTDIAISKFCFNGASLYVFLRVNIESDHDTIMTKWEVRNILLEKFCRIRNQELNKRSLVSLAKIESWDVSSCTGHARMNAVC